MKLKTSMAFKSAELKKDENGNVTIVERIKEDVVVTPFSKILDRLDGIQNLAISISTESEE